MEVSPGQLYTTASGHLYHAGKVCIIMVGLPARGKTHRAEAIARFLRWLGVKARAFHLSDYRRNIAGSEFLLPDDYYDPNGETQFSRLRREVINRCFEDIWDFYATGGQIAIYDAINHTATVRRDIAKKCRKHNVESLFVECLVSDERVLARNIGDVQATSPDYIGRDVHESVSHYLRRLEKRISVYESMSESELPFIKVMNDGDKCVVNHGRLGYLLNRVLLFLLNSRRRRGSVFFARAGATDDPYESYKRDEPLSPRGKRYATALANTLLGYINTKNTGNLAPHLDADMVRRYADRQPDSGSSSVSESTGAPDPSLVVWTSTRCSAMETGAPFRDAGIPVSHRSLLSLRNPGNAGEYTDAELKEKYPEDYAANLKDPYHHRYPRGESYQDVAIRLEPILMEMERVECSLLIIAHESVLRVLYGYLMGSSVEVIPSLEFPANQIIELVSTGYSNRVIQIPIEGTSADGGAPNMPNLDT